MSHEVVWLFRYCYDIITMLELEKERKKNAQIISHLTRECMLLHVEAGFHLLDFLTQPVPITKAWGQGWTFLSTLLILEGKLVFFAFNPVLPQKPPRAGFQPTCSHATTKLLVPYHTDPLPGERAVAASEL